MTFNYSEVGLPGIEKMDADFLLTSEETINFYKQYKTLKKKGYLIVSSDLGVHYASTWPSKTKTTIFKSDLPNLPKRSYYNCTLGRNQCFVSAQGNVYSCTKRWGNGLNIFDVGFKKAWDDFKSLDCVACKELGTIEQSLITSMQPKGLLNGLKNFVLRN